MRKFVIVMDSFGLGADSRAAEYGDAGANTAMHAAESLPGEKWAFLGKMGLGNAASLVGFAINGCPAAASPLADYGVLEKRGPGKDTLTGHWELAGLYTDLAMKVFPPAYPSFPPEITDRLKAAAGRPILGNYAASGTQIIQDLGEQAVQEKAIILYTSADSVMQLAAHEEAVPLQELYEICEAARKICDEFQVGRVIARPFLGNKEEGFIRTRNRHDFSIALPGASMLETYAHQRGYQVTAVGKISDIFNGQGIDKSYPDKGNEACLARTSEIAESPASSQELVFVNLVDTDMEYGHRRNPTGYCREVDRISRAMEQLYHKCGEGDVIAVTADHGCDPTFHGTDHTREYVPLLILKKGVNRPGQALGLQKGFGNCLSPVLNQY